MEDHNYPGIDRQSFVLYFPENYFSSRYIDKTMDNFYKKLRDRIKIILKKEGVYINPLKNKQYASIYLCKW